MSTTTNITSADANSLASTKSFFNNLSLPPVSVTSNVDDAVVAFFQSITETKDSARLLASAVILTSVSQGVDPMETLDEFKKIPTNQLNDYLAMFLNLSRVGTSFLGITNRPYTNKYVARMILP